MNSIKTNFSIKDLENLSGIKAHTIRIWEKRYNLFKPNRTDTNIRYYSTASLQKILNISFLNKNGYKISKIASLDENEISSLVKEIAESKDPNNHSINLLKLAMINFDQSLFNKTFYKLEEEMSFKTIFFDVFIPLLDHIGLLWQTDTITPAHEHFVVEIIKKKILVETEKAYKINTPDLSQKPYALFLPDNEMHELGLLFTNLELTLKGKHVIYLGQSVPIKSLEFLLTKHKDITFISNFTVSPENENVEDYLNNFSSTLLKNNKCKLLVSGRLLGTKPNISNSNIKTFESTKDLIDHINNEK
ncbi:DNA-binding transcriptional MerR regulator [Mesoflavibacter sabulilitoris]|uniref:MerR family transcriptional regulator n=1 Tax=Mesoflavibacter zeaxanthinifaciens subsp. sabulilitoris TaxID=1520893 RepID=A0A2T1NB95_9FLAO|nr:MerR family transcriptional regulator [Mesoflavibacter zeaxanthinifaciens]MBB3123483.1 DNA-binding transcriptional MerR regulator [Mesoflavibacter zeaxanthinifaciens subsp. sabulilitoris]MCP4052170.1 MerR family transcriptional regulator [Mesoflavibacter sp.]PSG89385.1 MerR family transcriptional regulator [Mesoflavibacter zeaxanthinifaciens subsp. sabulilitoris]